MTFDGHTHAQSHSKKSKMRAIWSSVVASLRVATAYAIDESSFAPADIIERDVAIIGGGASGTYAAVRLREDHNVSIVVVEKEDHLVSRSGTGICGRSIV